MVNAAKEKHEQIQFMKTEDLLPSVHESACSDSVKKENILSQVENKLSSCAGTVKIEEKSKEERVS